MERLGLWGSGTSFATFEAFKTEMSRRGVGALEMLAIEMKASGTYVSRSLGFKSAEFCTLEADLSANDERAYDAAVAFWNVLREEVGAALELTDGSNRVMQQYWSAHQRFFKQLCISMKLPTVIAEAKDALAAGHCVVLGLQTTGGTALEEMVAKSERVTSFVSVTRHIVTNFIANNFPTVAQIQPDGATQVMRVVVPDNATTGTALRVVALGQEITVIVPVGKNPHRTLNPGDAFEILVPVPNQTPQTTEKSVQSLVDKRYLLLRNA